MQSYLATRRRGHTLIELVAASISSAMLLAGLGSVMLIARQVAYTPSAALLRTDAAEVVRQLADEVQYATLLLGQTPHVLEFVVADRNGDGAAEKIHYEWSGTSGDPLRKSINGGAPVTVVESVYAFDAAFELQAETSDLTTIVDSAENVLFSDATLQAGAERDITGTTYVARRIDPATFPSIPADALYWNATKFEFYGRKGGSATATLLAHIRSTGEPSDSPTSHVLGQVSIPESALTGNLGWNTLIFSSPVRNLSLHRPCGLVLAGSGAGAAARVYYSDLGADGVMESNDAGASWQHITPRQIYGRVYGTYSTPGTIYNVTRNFVTHVRLLLQSGDQSHARIESSVPLTNVPELLSAYWRSDFERDPTATDANGDAVSDWGMAGGASFDPATLINGVWHAQGALETRPLHDFTRTTIIEVRCRNTSVGGNGAVMQISADRQSGLHAPLLVHVQLQPDGTQTLTLYGKSSDSNRVRLFSRPRLSSDFVRIRLTIAPQFDVVNLHINDEDQGAFTYPTYAPTALDRFVTLFADTSLVEFDYVDVRVATD